jgi:hypothetical protein
MSVDLVIRDYQGNQVDWAYVAAQGYRMTAADVVEFAGYGFHLTEMRETRGPADLHVCVRAEDGSVSHEGVYAARWYPGLVAEAGKADNVELPAEVKTVPGIGSRRALIARADVNTGEVGFGLGSGDVIHDSGGATSVCLASMTYPSAIVRRIGWLGGTEHWGMLRLTFQLGNIDPDDPDEPTAGTVADALHDAQEALMSAMAKIVQALKLMGFDN